MYTATNANPRVSTKDGIMGWFRSVEGWLDDRGKKAWIIATILGFIFAWPVGLALLVYMIWSKRMFTRSCANKSDHGGPWARAHSHMGYGSHLRSSGNAAFDAYKAETIRRLQEEQDAFEAFLQRLRDAKDKSEFDHFMEDRARANAAAVPATTAEAGAAKTGEY